MTVHHYRVDPPDWEFIKILKMPENEVFRGNWVELCSRAQMLLWGYWMLMPEEHEWQRRQKREAMTLLKKAHMVASGGFVVQGEDAF